MDEKKMLKDLFNHEPFVYYGIGSPHYIGDQKIKTGSFGNEDLAICERFYCYEQSKNQISITQEAVYCQLKERAAQELSDQETIKDFDDFFRKLKSGFKEDIIRQFNFLIEYEKEHKED